MNAVTWMGLLALALAVLVIMLYRSRWTQAREQAHFFGCNL